jgi:hypothetical protein
MECTHDIEYPNWLLTIGEFCALHSSCPRPQGVSIHQFCSKEHVILEAIIKDTSGDVHQTTVLLFDQTAYMYFLHASCSDAQIEDLFESDYNWTDAAEVHTAQLDCLPSKYDKLVFVNLSTDTSLKGRKAFATEVFFEKCDD